MRLTVLASLTALALALPAAAHAAAPPVQPGEIDGHLRALADIAAQNGGNRAAGLPGAEATAQYVAAQLTQAGWQVSTPQVTFPFPFDRSAPELGTFQAGRDFAVVRGSGAGETTARVRTILAERCSSRSLRSLRRGEIALVPFLSCSGERTAQLVQRAGGSAVILDSGPDTFPLRFTLMGSSRIPVLQVRSSIGVRLSRSRRPIHLKVDSGVEPRTAANVVAELPGRTADRVVMAGGHLDSVPESPGINDNASGVAALLEVAKRLPQEPRRATIRLGFWTAEELGLHGSRAYVGGLPRAERRKIRAYLNLDMVGSPNGLVEVYDSDDALERLLRRTHPGREGETDISGASDHTAFRRAGIPVGGIYTGALERKGRKYRDRCYHRPCDDVDNADRAVSARIATAAERALAELAR